MNERLWCSLNNMIKMLLRKALGLKPAGNRGRKADFAEFGGVWSNADGAEFDRKTQDLREIDPREWK